MSKFPDTTPYKRYFEGVIKKMKARPFVDEMDRSVYLSANIPLQGKDNSVRVEIFLALSDDQSCLIVDRFTVTTADPFSVLWGSDFLEHYGKQLGGNDLRRLWTMTRAADLQAMLRAYDNLAKEIGKPTLFGH